MTVSAKEATMHTGQTEGLQLSEEEAYSILTLCLTSPQGLDAVSEKALRKLAAYCSAKKNSSSNHISQSSQSPNLKLELNQAGM